MHVDVPLLAICVKVYIKDGKFNNSCVSINNGTSFAQRDYQLESFLNTSASTPEAVNQAMNHLDVNIYDKRNDEYKSHMFRVSIKNALLEVIKAV